MGVGSRDRLILSQAAAYSVTSQHVSSVQCTAYVIDENRIDLYLPDTISSAMGLRLSSCSSFVLSHRLERFVYMSVERFIVGRLLKSQAITKAAVIKEFE